MRLNAAASGRVGMGVDVHRRHWLAQAGQAVVALAAAGGGLAHASQYDDYVRAIISDNERAMVNLIFRGFDPNTRDTRGRPGLVAALHQGSLGVFDVLLKSPGIKVNEASQQGETPLMMACIKGHLDLAKELIRRGADVNRPGWTPLHYATSADLPKTLDIVKLLLDNSAYIDADSPNGTTPLMLAAQYSSEAVVDLLIKEGADVILSNQRGFTAADFARQVDRQYMVDKLTKAIKAERKTQPSRGSW
ncbi:ankyrin repeat domain-containing protein [Delftia acidovorans]|uniref:ankyrin repeat domain-containing protein n=1 Tax=Delftia acidovorans TaxID=80866 RepID=UPI0032E013C9